MGESLVFGSFNFGNMDLKENKRSLYFGFFVI